MRNFRGTNTGEVGGTFAGKVCGDSKIALGFTSLSSKKSQVSKNSPVPSGSSDDSKLLSESVCGTSPPVTAQLKVSKNAGK